MKNISSSYHSDNSLRASKSYNKVGSENFGAGIKLNDPSSTDFNKEFNATFNSFSRLSPEQILNVIRKSGESASQHNIRSDKNLIGNIVKDGFDGIRKVESSAQKNLVGEGSILEIATEVKKASAALDMLSAVVRQATQAWDKIFSMQI